MSDLDDLSGWLADRGQDHLLRHLDRLDRTARAELVADLGALDRAAVDEALALVRGRRAPVPPRTIEPLPAVQKGEDAARDEEARAAGEALLREGRVAAFVVAGGQGTRLGHLGPKGTFPATPITGKPLFRLFAEKVRALGAALGARIPLYVLTSPENREATTRAFAESGSWGLDPRDLAFLTQGTMPAVDAGGRLLLAGPTRLFRSPDGHGGSLLALKRSGALDAMRARGVEEIFYFQVDNPLVVMCDPVFLGYHRRHASAFSSKAVRKTDPGEKVGVLARIDGKPGVIEYSDLAPELREARDAGGALRLRAGNIAIHALRRAFVEDLVLGRFRLPFHLARKPIPTIDAEGRPCTVDGIKFETFVFDALPFADRALVLEVPRAAEFSPIKNRDGPDSVETAHRDQVALHASWLEAAGVRVPRGPDGVPAHPIEISPLFAHDERALARRRDLLPGAVTGPLALEHP